MTRDDEQLSNERLGDWLATGPHVGRTLILDAAIARARSTSQRPGWLVRLTGGTVPQRPGSSVLRFAMLAISAVLLIGLVVGSLVVGGVLSPKPIPSILAIGSAEPTPTRAPVATQGSTSGLVAYATTQCNPVGSSGTPYLGCSSTGWLARSDGSGARELPGTPLGWSADGSRLLVETDSAVIVTDATGAELATFPIWCSSSKGDPLATSCPGTENVLCTFPCTMAASFALSPDGTRVAFVRGYANNDNATVVAILDLGSGAITELSSTRTTNPPTEERCYEITTCQGDDDTPRWSPDGTRIVFARQTMSPDQPDDAWTSAALFVVDADGANLRRVTPTGLVAVNPVWSPDGTRLVFTNTEFVVNADRTSVLAMKPDVYTIGVDGSDLSRLTTDGVSSWPVWTSDGRVAFVRQIDGGSGGQVTFQAWSMASDGSGQIRLDASLSALAAAGCTTCAYPSADAATLNHGYWQPAP